MPFSLDFGLPLNDRCLHHNSSMCWFCFYSSGSHSSPAARAVKLENITLEDLGRVAHPAYGPRLKPNREGGDPAWARKQPRRMQIPRFRCKIFLHLIRGKPLSRDLTANDNNVTLLVCSLLVHIVSIISIIVSIVSLAVSARGLFWKPGCLTGTQRRYPWRGRV